MVDGMLGGMAGGLGSSIGCEAFAGAGVGAGAGAGGLASAPLAVWLKASGSTGGMRYDMSCSGRLAEVLVGRLAESGICPMVGLFLYRGSTEGMSGATDGRGGSCAGAGFAEGETS